MHVAMANAAAVRFEDEGNCPLVTTSLHLSDFAGAEDRGADVTIPTPDCLPLQADPEVVRRPQ
tara:strand:- start:1497 stop:1685 length:189 start_codon:yes stop_codon:yes gene_type:complete